MQLNYFRTIPRRLLGALLLACAVSACQTVPPPQPQPQPPQPTVEPPAKPAPEPKPPAPPPAAATMRPATWASLPGWNEDSPAQAWDAFLTSCTVLRRQDAWRDVCSVAQSLGRPDNTTARRFFEENFTPRQMINAEGGEEGLATGYYEPLLRGSRKPSKRYRFPLYGVPDDLLVVDLGELYPELKNMRLRGRLEGRRIVPYYDRAQIENGRAAVKGKELVWVDDPIELFFLQIQGSGRVRLENGEMMRVGYGDQNGHPYRSIGRLLVERGELTLDRASMQGIKAWAQQNPAKVTELLNQNGSYVFFRELPGDLPGPLGALGVPLTAQRSIAIDPRFVPLGVPVFLSTTWPNTTRPLNRLMMAQDTGGAIRGPIRADYFWGFGDDAGREAGRMKQTMRLWVILPNGYTPPAGNSM